MLIARSAPARNMRLLSFPIVIALMTIGLSGCFGSGDTPPTDPVETCDDEARMNVTNEECYEAPALPNVLPNATLTITDDAGRELNASAYVLVGSNMTFSANGSVDPDGEISLIGISVTDANGTRTAQLFDNGTFVDVKLRFDVAGPVNITMNVLDDDGEGVTRVARTAVNEMLSETFTFDANAPSGSADACQAPGASSGAPGLITDSYALKGSFSVAKGAQWISAKVTSGSGEIAICSPGDPGTALSAAGTEVNTEDDGNSTLTVNPQYYVMVLKKGAGGGTVTVETMVHFETKTAA